MFGKYTQKLTLLDGGSELLHNPNKSQFRINLSFIRSQILLEEH